MVNSAESHVSIANTHRRLVLASTSTYRKQLLERLRIAFDVIDPGINESRFKRNGLPAYELARTLAETKAHAVGLLRHHNIILGCDQCAAIDGHVLGKPKTFDGAVKQLTLLSGRTHALFTAMCLLEPYAHRHRTVVDVHDMTMRRLSHDQIRRYVEIDQPMDCAGAYKIESLGIALFERVTGNDPTAIIGLPLMRLVTMLGEIGFDVFGRG